MAKKRLKQETKGQKLNISLKSEIKITTIQL